MSMKLLAGNSNRQLSEAIAQSLDVPLTRAQVKRFPDNEAWVVIEENVRGEDVFVIQSTSYPANDNLMELLVCIDALKRASARRITAVTPYFGYARQDRKTGGRTPISAKLVANLITRAGADRLLTMDLHSGQIQGFFDIPTDNLQAAPLMAADIQSHYARTDELLIVSPDVGGVVRALALASRLNSGLAIVDKRRKGPGQSEVANIIGEVAGRRLIIFDDIVDSATTLCSAAKSLMEAGAADHPRRALRRGGRAGQRLGAEGTRGHRLDRERRPSRIEREDPRRQLRFADRRGDPTNRQRGIGLQAVRLTGTVAVPARCHSSERWLAPGDRPRR
jgi:ribose-phosphate pyrophosphokinase